MSSEPIDIPLPEPILKAQIHAIDAMCLQVSHNTETAEYLRSRVLGTESLRAPSPPTIWHHGGLSYSTDGVKPRKVTPDEHNVLTAFLNKDEALDTSDLERKCTSNASAVIAKLEKRFGEAVSRPIQKGEGYYIRVRSRPAN